MQIQVIIHPQAKQNQVTKDSSGQIHLDTTAPAREGKANKAAIELLAKYFEVKKNQIFLIQGNKSKQKIFSISK